MRRASSRIGLAVLVEMLGFTAMAPADDRDHTLRHSEAIVEFDPDAGGLVLEEVGPWRVVNGETVVTRVTIELADSTTTDDA